MFPQLARFTDLGLLLLRLMVGLVFVTSGYSHLKDPEARSKSTAPALPTTRTARSGAPRAARPAPRTACRMIERRARQAGIQTKIGNHSLRATGITDYLKINGSLAEARRMANHSDTRTTQLYDRRSDTASLREYEKVGI